MRNATVGFSATTVEHQHPWRYPAVDLSKFREAPFLDEPEILVVSSYDLEPVAEALRSDKLLLGYRGDPACERPDRIPADAPAPPQARGRA